VFRFKEFISDLMRKGEQRSETTSEIACHVRKRGIPGKYHPLKELDQYSQCQDHAAFPQAPAFPAQKQGLTECERPQKVRSVAQEGQAAWQGDVNTAKELRVHAQE
jgi:hypothetical protein